MYKVGRDKIREQLDKYIKCLKADYAKNLILPKKDDTAQVIKKNSFNLLPLLYITNFLLIFQAQTKSLPANHVTSNKAVINDSNIKTPSTEKSEKPLGVKLDCKTLLLEEKFQCKVSELWDCFSRIEPMTAFTRGEVKLNFSKNGE
jgi:hypothetical protein